MFAVEYTFKVKKGQDNSFVEAWSELTKLIYKYEGSLGSRLHHKEKNIYIAYAQWPDKETWKNMGDKLPSDAKEWSAKMKAACESIETSHELDVIDDLLSSNAHSKQ